jgi:uncharacterized protein (TIGR03067 family)
MPASMLPVVAVLACYAARHGREVRSELDALQGEWKCVSVEVKGKPLPADTVAKFRFTVKGDRSARTMGDEPWVGRIRLGPLASPKRIELREEPHSPSSPMAILLGVYKREGDTLTLCLGWPSDPPSAFETTKSGVVLSVWKRPKK